MVIAIFKRREGLKEASRVKIDGSGNLLTVVNARSKEIMIPLSAVKQVWSQGNVYTYVVTCDDKGRVAP